MGAKIRFTGEGDTGNQGIQKLYTFYCPGCKAGHGYHVPRWTWNGSMDKPTFTPSLRCIGVSPDGKQDCHITMTDGKIQFHSDSCHDLKNQVLDMEDVDSK